jgi:hypothetical protein
LVKKIEPVVFLSCPLLIAPHPALLLKVKTLAANVAVGQAKKKKENPYLSHHRGGSAVKSAGEGSVDPPAAAAATPVSTTPLHVHDERIKTSSRDLRAKRAFNFIEAGDH